MNKKRLITISIIVIVVAAAIFQFGFRVGFEYGKSETMHMVNDMLNCYDWSCLFENNQSIDIKCALLFVEKWWNT